jgi:hypothetical protein
MFGKGTLQLAYMPPQGSQPLTFVSLKVRVYCTELLYSLNWTSKKLLVKSFNTSLHLYIWNLTQALEDVR